MKTIVSLVTAALLFAVYAETAQAQNNNNNQNNNQNNGQNNQNNGQNNLAVVPPPPRVSRPARIRNKLLFLSPQAFMALADVGTDPGPPNPPVVIPGSPPDGRVSPGEFLSALVRLGRNNNLNGPQVQSLFNSMDHDADGFITLMDFSVFVPIVGT